MKRLLIGAVILVATLPVWSQCPTVWGKGSDIPQNLKINGGCLLLPNQGTLHVGSWYGGVPGQVQVTFTTQQPGDTFVNIDYYNGQAYSAATVFEQFYDPTLVGTSSPSGVWQKLVQLFSTTLPATHTMIVGNLLPNRTYLIVPSTCNANCSGGKNGLRGARYDPGWSVSGYGEGAHQTHGFTFTTPNTNPSAPLSWRYQSDGPPEAYQGQSINVDLIGMQRDGPVPAWIHATSMKVDGANCTEARSGAVCTNGIKLIFADGGGEVLNAYGNYNTVMPTTGVWANMMEVGGNTTGILAYSFQQPGDVLNITQNGTPLGNHCVDITFQAADINQVAIGPVVPLHYCWNTIAASFTYKAPTQVPPIPATVIGKINGGISQYGIPFYNAFQADNLQLGKYDNDNYSAVGSATPHAVWNYTGEQVALFLHDYDQSNANCATCGTPDYWNLQAQRVVMQRQAWAVNMTKQNTWQEWNNFPRGMWMYAARFGDPNGLFQKGINSLAYPLVPSATHVSTQPCIWTMKFTQTGTWRSQPYCSELLLTNWLVNGQPVITPNSHVNEWQVRKDRLLQTLIRIRTYNPLVSDSNQYPCCISMPAFDGGLGLRPLIEGFAIECAQGTCDPRIPVEIKKFLDWIYTTEYNQSGSDYTMPYTLWLVPAGPTLWNFSGSKTLNTLIAPAYTWAQMVLGDGCAMPDGKSCIAVSDEMTLHAFDADAPIYGAKAFNQIYTWLDDYWRWRTGKATGLEVSMMRKFNTPQTVPDNMEPFNGGSFPQGYPKCVPGTNSVSCQWITFRATTSCTLKAAIRNSNGSCPTPTSTATSGPGVKVVGMEDQWMCTTAITSGLTSAKQYCDWFGATAAGIDTPALSNINPANGGPYNFTTH